MTFIEFASLPFMPGLWSPLTPGFRLSVALWSLTSPFVTHPDHTAALPAAPLKQQ